jgi:hypothetical protein
MEITIPTHLSEVPLYKMVEYNSLPHLEENERAIKAVSIFLGLTNKETARLPLKVLNKAIEHIKNILSESPELQPTFEYKGVKYGFVPNLDDLTTGEFIDIETYQKEPKDTYKVLSVLYRSITKEGQGNRYLIAPYKGEINEAFREMPSDVAFGALLFFWRLEIDLLTYTLKSLDKKTVDQMKTNLAKNGVGWGSYTSSLEEMLLNLDKLVNFPFILLSCGALTSQTWRSLKGKLLIKNDEQR